MGTISFGQLFIVSLLLILVFGDMSSIIKKLNLWINNPKLKNKSKKKGI